MFNVVVIERSTRGDEFLVPLALNNPICYPLSFISISFSILTCGGDPEHAANSTMPQMQKIAFNILNAFVEGALVSLKIYV